MKFPLSLLLLRSLKLLKLLLDIDGGQSLCSRLINARHLYAIDVVEGSFDRHLFCVMLYSSARAKTIFVDCFLLIIYRCVIFD